MQLVIVVILVVAVLSLCMLSACVKEGFAKSTKSCDKPVILKDFLTPNECSAIIEAAEAQGLHRSTVVSKTPMSKSRTSHNVFLSRDDPASQAVFDKVEKIVGVSRTHFERVQVLRYTIGQKYSAHMDSCKKCEDGRDILRTDTLFINLNEGFEGGETDFPKAKFTSTPKQGQALWWKNIDENDNNLPCALHAAKPVTFGVKYACNVWVRRRPLVKTGKKNV